MCLISKPKMGGIPQTREVERAPDQGSAEGRMNDARRRRQALVSAATLQTQGLGAPSVAAPSLMG
jgi:hypothetical protein